MKQRIEAAGNSKLWSTELDMPLTLSGALSVLTKNELLAIRSHFGVKGASALKKQELVELLVQAIPERLPQLLSLMDETRYKIVRKLAQQGGSGSFDLLEFHEVLYFKERGLIFPGTHNGNTVLAVPQEIVQAFNEFSVSAADRETMRSNFELIKLAQGLLYYYGALSREEFDSLLQRHMTHELSEQDHAVLRESADFYELIRFEDEMISHARVVDAEQVKKEHQERPELDFYPYSTKELLQAGEPGFLDRTPVYDAMVSFIKNNYTISSEHADFLVEECVYAIRNGEPPSRVFKQLQSDLEMDDVGIVQAFMNHVSALNNTTKQWYIKGYSSEELSPRKQEAAVAAGKADVSPMETKKKIGRNDPCPCGSNKKYKKCCGA